MPDECAHARTIRNVTPSALGCEECLKLGSAWVHLRLCRTCGHVGCCDSSPNRHATSIFARPAIPSSKATIRRKGGDGAMSMKLVWTLAAARRRITDLSRGTIKFAASGKIAAVLHPSNHALRAAFTSQRCCLAQLVATAVTLPSRWPRSPSPGICSATSCG